MYLLDTNLLAPGTSYNAFPAGSLFTSSVSAQEVLGMQRPGREAGYRYALPVLDGRFPGIQQTVPIENLARVAIEHAARRPVSKQADRQVVRRSLLRAESLELGHEAVAIAHDHGHDRLFRAFASRGLQGATLKRVLGKWEYLRNDVEAIIPLDAAIAEQALVLANRFVEMGFRAKGTTRNTMNDMLVAATSHINGMNLLTADSQLNEFYKRFGWSVREADSLFIVTPPRNDVANQAGASRRAQSRGFINRPRSLRSRTDQTPPPLPH